MLTLNFQSFALFVTLALINEIISSVKSANAFHDEDTTTIDSTTSSYVTDMFIERFGNKIKEEINNSMVGVEDVTKSNGKGKKHPCQRSCKKDRVMTCKYHFVIEYYTVMSKACFNCPFNKSHCESNYCIPGDGVTRTILTVNRQMPGPTIEVCLGDSIEVEVTNKLMDVSTAIHWHGLLQKNTPFMDGVPFVSQCPIGPRESFLYSFYADAPGTHLWHAHSALQRGDGIYGALIVKVPPHQNPHLRLYDFDLPQHVFTVMDWVHLFSPDKFMRHIHAAEDNQPPNLLINGKGQYREFENEGKIEFTPVETFNVKKGFRYRFRLVNAGFLNCPIVMSVDNHNITIIATDGSDLKPTEAVSLVSLAGERYDFIISADKEVKNYWIRFKGLLDCRPKGAFQVALLHYEGASTDYPQEKVTYETAGRSGLPVNEVNAPADKENSLLISELSGILTASDDPALRLKPDYKFYISYDFYPVDNTNFQYAPSYGHFKFPQNQRILTPQMNHISMDFPPFALLTDLGRSRKLQFCNGSSVSMKCRFEYCECIHVLQVPLNAVVEIILIDEGLPYNANHPFHLHGYKFKVLGMDRLGNSTTEEIVRNLDKEGLLKRNFDNPPIKDTITTPDGGYTILRFQATNPGYWIFHCHIDFHMELGMALLFKVGDDTTYRSPPKNFPRCGDYSHDYQASFHSGQSYDQLTDSRVYYSILTSQSNHLTFSHYLLFLIFFVALMQY